MSSPSPPPSTSNPSPLTIGRSFLKQFYHVLTTTPDMIYKFYRPSSVLSHGEGNNPTSPVTMDSLGDSPAKDMKDRFFSWAASESDPVRFELEHGAIDAQESVNGGVLLVVTGHMYLGDVRKAFCHTFFLNLSAPDSKKRSYYVHNDVLRFLHESEPPLKEAALSSVQETEEENDNDNEKALDESKGDDQQPQEAQHPKSLPQTLEPAPQTKEEEQTPSQIETLTPEEQEEGVEESKEEPEDSEDDQQLTDAPTEEEGVEESKEEPEEEEKEQIVHKDATKDNTDKDSTPAPQTPRATPGSWASLVASGGNTTPTQTAPPTPPAPKPSVPKPVPKPPKSAEPEPKEREQIAKQEHKSRHKRDPDCTIVVKNVPHDTKESDVRTMFEPFATQSKASIIGINVSAHKGLAFVDYDNVAPVLAIIAKDKEGPFTMGGRTLEVEQKTLDIRRREGRRNFRSGSPGNGYSRRNNNSHQRHRGGGRGDRGGGRGGRGGGGGGR